MNSNRPASPDAPATRDEVNTSERHELARFHRKLNLLASAAIVLVALVYLLREFATVLQHLMVAMLLIYLLMPIHHWLLRHRVSPMLSCILIVSGILVSFSALGVLIGNSIGDLQTKLPEYEKSLVRLIHKATEQLPGLDNEQRAGLDPEALGLDKGTQIAQAALGKLSSFLSQAFVVVIYLVFMLAERAGLRERLEKAFAAQRVQEIEDVTQRINAAITQYIVVKTCMGLLAGALTAAVLLAFGVDYSLLWGILTFLFNYIPYLGSIVASVLPVLLSLVQFGDPLATLCILVLLLLVQNLIGYLIEPRLAGRRLDLSPLVIIVSLAFWGSLWGVVGMILAVPLVVVIKTVLEHMAPTRPLARMLANG